MYTVGRLARKFNLSRSTLLYYDRIGLLKPSARSESDYRYYSEKDAKRLEQICVYREAGLRLQDIKSVLESPESSLTQILVRRLGELNEDIQRIRNQQRVILGILKSDQHFDRIGVMNKNTWVSILAASGFSEVQMLQWHIEFERLSPEKHLEFLRFLCLSDEEIQRIRTLDESSLQ